MLRLAAILLPRGDEVGREQATEEGLEVRLCEGEAESGGEEL